MEEDNISFDQQWNQAFADAEMAPPEHVWTAIDGQLSGAAADSYKSQLVIYRWAAAACILLLMLFGWGYWPGQRNSSGPTLSDGAAYTEPSIIDNENSSSDTIKDNRLDSKNKESKIDKVITEDSVKESGKNLKKSDGSLQLLTFSTESSENTSDTPLGNDESDSEVAKSGVSKPALENQNVTLLSENTTKESNTEIVTPSIEEKEQTQSHSATNSYADNGLEVERTNTSKRPVEHSLIAIDQSKDSKESSIVVKQLTINELKREEMFNTQMDNIDFTDDVIASSIQPPKFIYGVPLLPTKAEMQQLNKLWAGVVMSTGSFNPSLGISNADEDFAVADQEEFIVDSPTSFSEQDRIQDINEEPVSYSLASSVSGGFAVGTRVRNRFIVSSGIALNAIKTDQTSTSLVDQDGTLYALTGDPLDNNLELAINDSEVEFVGSTVSLSNEYKYLSVPIKAGYILLDKQFNITLNTGISSNFLLDAQLVSDGTAQSINNNSNTRDNYRDVYFNLLTSVEFGYIIAKKYQLSLEPNYNRALTNFNQSGNLDKSKPSNLGIALGIKYNF